MVEHLLRYDQVDISYRGELAVKQVSFAVDPGEILGIVGESGSGKSTLIKAAMGLLSQEGVVTRGDIWYRGKNITDLPGKDRRRLNGPELGYIFQNAGSSFSPIRTVGVQLYETMKEHSRISKKEFQDRALELLAKLGFSDGMRILKSYPFELSGGMQQRVGIAAAMLLNPRLLLADEPTSALDVSVQAQIIELLKKLCEENGTAVILVTHDMGVIAETADRVAVMYAGRLAEIGPVEEMIHDAEHPYTIGLMGSIPKIGDEQDRLSQIPGAMPHLTEVPSGCAFHPRCPLAEERCIRERPGLQPCGNKLVACWKAGRQNKRMQFPQEPFTIRAPEDMPR